MLIKGLGRVEGTVEDLQPVTLKQLIPIELLNSFIGIYWHVGKGKFIIYKAPLLDAKYAVVEMGQDYDEQSNTDDLQIDYNIFHMDIWYEDVLKKYPEFTGCEFDYFSRGRILYEVQQKKFVIYGSKRLLNSAKVVEFLAQEFALPEGGFLINDKIYKDKDDVRSLGERECAGVSVEDGE